MSPGYQGALGYGFATALGAKVANPDRVVVSINGDGGFSWNLQELSTMRKYNIGAVAVVFNDSAFGNIRRTQVEDFDSRYIGTDLVNPDYQLLAAAFGIASARVDSPDGLRAPWPTRSPRANRRWSRSGGRHAQRLAPDPVTGQLGRMYRCILMPLPAGAQSASMVSTRRQPLLSYKAIAAGACVTTSSSRV